MTGIKEKIDLDSITDAVQILQKQQRALSILLNEQRTRAGHHLALHVRMGEVSSYVTSVSLRWIAENVGFAADLPIFRESVVGSKRIKVDQETVEQIQQRQPDWRRQLQITAYLVTRKYHKFPPLLLVGYQKWVYSEKSEQWGTDKRAMQDSLTLTGLEPSGTYWDLDDRETKFYALDGQHRLMAILGLKDLVTTGNLHALDEHRNPKQKSGLSREEIVDLIHNNTGEDHVAIHERLQHLMDERIGIEIVPAVTNGESYDNALRRLRQLFVDVNEHAKPLTTSELTQLDESNGFRVVARKIMIEHSLLRSSGGHGERIDRVDTKKTTLPESSESYTTLKTLAIIVRNYLTENKTLVGSENFVSWNSLVAKNVFIRPEDEMLTNGVDAMRGYFNALVRLPSHEGYINGKSASSIRKESGDDNILFRPVAQTALAEAIGKLLTKGSSLENIVQELARQETRGQLKLRDKTSPWFGVLCDPAPPHKMRRYKGNEMLCCRLFQYLLGGGISDDDERDHLRKDFAISRRIDEEHAVAMDGREVLIEQVRLPSPWR